MEGGNSDTHEREKTYWDLKESLVIEGASMDCMLQTRWQFCAITTPQRYRPERGIFILSYTSMPRLPGVTVLVAEGGERPSLDAGECPPHCHYAFFTQAGPCH